MKLADRLAEFKSPIQIKAKQNKCLDPPNKPVVWRKMPCIYMYMLVSSNHLETSDDASLEESSLEDASEEFSPPSASFTVLLPSTLPPVETRTKVCKYFIHRVVSIYTPYMYTETHVHSTLAVNRHKTESRHREQTHIPYIVYITVNTCTQPQWLRKYM